MPSKRVLVADGDASRRTILIALLREAGYEAVAVDDADTAREALGAAEPDLVLLDLALSGLDPMILQRALGGDPGLTPETLESIERRHLQQTLRFTGGNRSRAAKLLGISRSTLLAKIRRYQLR